MYKDTYTVKKINDTTYQIDEMGRDFCYLLLGSEKALLIDCSIGTGDLKALVESITSLPVTVAATHAHADHTGGAWQFGKVYVHESECNLLFKLSNCQLYREKVLSKRMRKAGISRKGYEGKIWDWKFVPFSDGFEIDLGGRTLKAFHTPGHSPGSCVWVDEKEKMMFTGDNTMPFLLMTVYLAESLETWLVGAQKTLELSKTYQPWSSHGEGLQTSEQIEHTITLVREILEKYPENSKKKEIIHYPPNSHNCVVFNRKNIHN